MKTTSFTLALAAITGLVLAGAPITVQAATTTPATAPAAAPVKVKKTEYKGTLTAIDPASNTVTVKSGSATLTLAIVPTTKIQKNKKPATLADFALGEKVTGSYTKDAAGAMTAYSFRTSTAKTPAKATANTVSTGTAPVTTGTAKPAGQ